MSETTPEPRAIVLAEPAAWRHLKTMRRYHLFVGTRASAMHASDNNDRQTTLVADDVKLTNHENWETNLRR